MAKKKAVRQAFTVSFEMPPGMKVKAATEFVKEALIGHLLDLSSEGIPAENCPAAETIKVSAVRVPKPAAAK